MIIYEASKLESLYIFIVSLLQPQYFIGENNDAFKLDQQEHVNGIKVHKAMEPLTTERIYQGF